MNDGLITRIGKWMDRKWAAKATWLDVQEQESKCSQRHCGALEAIADTKATLQMEFHSAIQKHATDIHNLKESKDAMSKLMIGFNERLESLPKDDLAKEVAALKTRLEQLEIYTNMSRKVDPTKPAVAKSAFAM